MAKQHEDIALSLLKKRHNREFIKKFIMDTGVTENVANISITRASKALVEQFPEFRK